MSAAKSILIVEDEADLSEVLAFHLEKDGYQCRRVFDGASALAEIARDSPDLVILDRMLPKLSGDEVATRLKRDPRTQAIPIVMLTAKAEEMDELIGFAIGADEYIRKPVSVKVLLARINAILRRREVVDAGEALSGGPIHLDRARHEVTVDGTPIHVTATELRILAALMQARGRVMERNRLIDLVLGAGVAVTLRTIDVHVAALRRKLGAGGEWIHTVRGVGYSFRPPG